MGPRNVTLRAVVIGCLLLAIGTIVLIWKSHRNVLAFKRIQLGSEWIMLRVLARENAIYAQAYEVTVWDHGWFSERLLTDRVESPSSDKASVEFSPDRSKCILKYEESQVDFDLRTKQMGPYNPGTPSDRVTNSHPEQMP